MFGPRTTDPGLRTTVGASWATENNVGLWEFHNGMRRVVRFSSRDHKFMLDRSKWHELMLTVDQANRSDFKDYVAVVK